MIETVYNVEDGSTVEREMDESKFPRNLIVSLKNQGINALDCDLDYIDDAWVFNSIRYRNRIAEEQKVHEYVQNRAFMNKISEDIIQALAGVEIENLKEQMNNFCTALNAVRKFEGKDAKNYKMN